MGLLFESLSKIAKFKLIVVFIVLLYETTTVSKIFYLEAYRIIKKKVSVVFVI